jgi:dTDP-4-amino-4,6-dideoxygalactose transaminase
MQGDGQSWNMFSVLLPLDRMTIDRRQFRAELDARGIGSGVSYEALHLSTLGRSLGGGDGQFPVSERIGRETVTLPLHTRMDADDVDRVCTACADILNTHRR